MRPFHEIFVVYFLKTNFNSTINNYYMWPVIKKTLLPYYLLTFCISQKETIHQQTADCL